MDTVRAYTLFEEPGEPAPEGYIPLSVPEISGNEWTYVKECLDAGWVSSAGPFVDRFEQSFAAAVGARFAVATVNGTAALHTTLLAAGVEPGDEVLVNTLTFIAPVNAIAYCGAHPVLMDADPHTWQLDAGKVERFLAEECKHRNGECRNRRSGRRVRAILAVHVLGLACEVDRLRAVAQTHGLILVEDAAEAMGVRHRGRHVGTSGTAAAFSFNGNKVITAGGGGMISTNDPQVATRARYLTEQAKDDPIEYVHNAVGYNYRLTALQAAVGLAQLERLGEFVERKRAIARTYVEALRSVEGITLMPEPDGVEPTYWLYTVLLHHDTTLEERKAFIGELNRRGIGARPFWHPIHTLPPYRDSQSYRIEHAAHLYHRGVSLPSSVGLRPDDQQRVITELKDLLARPA